MSVALEIERLAQLRASGALSEEEFQRAKARVLEGQPAASTAPVSGGRPFRRSSADVWLGGVCGGLADFTGLESWVWRVLFVIGAATGGFGIVAYLLLWIFVPRA